MNIQTRAKLQRSLPSLTLDDLKAVVKKLKLKDVLTSGSKGKLIDRMCASPTLSNGNVLARLLRIAEYFSYGGQETLTLFKVSAALPAKDIAEFGALFGRPGNTTIVDGTTFRFAGTGEVEYHGNRFYSAKYEFPGGRREVDDFTSGPLEYIPATPAECIFRCQTNPDSVVLDIRCVATQAANFAKCITGQVWGKDTYGAPLQVATGISLSHGLTMKLRDRFKARSYQVKVSEADEEIQGKLHPSTTEFTSKRWDLTTQRKKLGVSTAAEDMAHGLEFDDKYEAIVKESGCKINLHYPTNQIRFMKTSSFGAYDAVISAILELSDA